LNCGVQALDPIFQVCAWLPTRRLFGVVHTALQPKQGAAQIGEGACEARFFLEGTPTVSRLNQIHIGADVPKQLQSDKEAELHTNSMYNEAIRLADEAKDAATRDLLESIVKEEDAHVDWLEAQLDQIAQLGVPLYLSTQTRA